MEEGQNFTLTENGAVTNKSTLNANLDFFGLGGSLRNREEVDIISLFQKAFDEESLIAMRTLFYFRDIRGGQGERRTARVLINWLSQNYPQIVIKNIENIPFFGRWDDLFSTFDTEVESVALKLIKKTLEDDMASLREGGKVSLLGKWLASENTSSKKTRKNAEKIRKYLGFSQKKYRKSLSALRKEIKIVEKSMCQNEWGLIDYRSVPSRAAMIYRNAFKKHDEQRYAQYLKDVEEGKTEIKASTLYPYDLVRKYKSFGYRWRELDKTLEAQWKALPNYLKGNEHNGLVVCDTSGSMYSAYGENVAPIDVSLSLALYISERNVGAFHNYFLTFSEESRLQKVTADNLLGKLNQLCASGWGMNTNLQSSFKEILDYATMNNVEQSDMPSVLYIVSDMEFDDCVEGRNFDEIKLRYERAGYEMPQIIFWNVNARNDQAPITKNDKGVALVSGCSPAIFKSLMLGKTIEPLDVMLDTINQERYKKVVV